MKSILASGSKYELIERHIGPENLLLDPNNPRLKKDDFARISVTANRVASDKVQNTLLTLICEDEHSVKPLMASIKNQGFVELDSLLVQRVADSDKYVVLEGNRRIAAIKRLLENPAKLSKSTLRSLKKIKVKELLCDDDSDVHAIVDSIIALRHISGPKDWQPMQRAFAIFTSYARQFKKRFGNAPLSHSAKVAREVAYMLGQTPAKVKEEVAIFVTFQHLQKNGYEVRSAQYSLIQLMISRPKFASECFDINRLSLSFGVSGMERFNSLCIEPNCPVQNPFDLRSFYKVFNDGTESDLDLIVAGSRSIANVIGDIKDRKRGSRFVDRAGRVLAELEEIKVSDFNGSDDEARIIVRIKGLVDRRLWPLAAKYLDVE